MMSAFDVDVGSKVSASVSNERLNNDATLQQVTLPTIGRILCCLCGVSIIPNTGAMCGT